MKFEKKTYELNLEQFEATCVQLNSALQNKTYLVGNELSIGMLKIILDYFSCYPDLKSTSRLGPNGETDFYILTCDSRLHSSRLLEASF